MITKKYIYKVWQDDYDQSPDTWGDENVFLIANHREFSVKNENADIRDIDEYFRLKNIYGDKTAEDISEIGKENLREYAKDYLHAIGNIEDDWEEYDVNSELLSGWWDYNQWKDKYGEYEIYPLLAYIHSGVSLSIFDGYPFNCEWDSGQVGWVLVNKKENFGDRTLIKVAEDLIETWNCYLTGDVWAFGIYEVTTCECCNNESEVLIDSCGGFYGEKNAIESAKLEIKNYEEK